jgi:hypothetical protein
MIGAICSSAEPAAEPAAEAAAGQPACRKPVCESIGSDRHRSTISSVRSAAHDLGVLSPLRPVTTETVTSSPFRRTVTVERPPVVRTAES